MCIPICRDAPRGIRPNGVVSSHRDGCTMIQHYKKCTNTFYCPIIIILEKLEKTLLIESLPKMSRLKAGSESSQMPYPVPIGFQFLFRKLSYRFIKYTE